MQKSLILITTNHRRQKKCYAQDHNLGLAFKFESLLQAWKQQKHKIDWDTSGEPSKKWFCVQQEKRIHSQNLN